MISAQNGHVLDDLGQGLGIIVRHLFDVLVVASRLDVLVLSNRPVSRNVDHANLLSLINKERPRERTQEQRQ